MDKQRTVFLLLGILFFTAASTFFLSMYGPNLVYGFSDGIILKDPASFYDTNGKLNIVGVIDNNGDFPVDATVGVNVTGRSGNESTTPVDGSSNSSKSLFSTVTSPTYARVIYPGTGAPFKIVLS